MNAVKIFGLAGTNGAGKDAMGIYLAENHHFLFISVTELLRDECRRRGLEVTREHTRAISAEWRREFGLAVLIDRAMVTYHELAKKNGPYAGVIIASLRNPYEADRIHQLGGKVVWLDADQRLRYDRIQANAEKRMRASEDDKTFEQFVAEEEAEMHPPAGGDAATLNTAAVKEKADIHIDNSGNDFATFTKEIRQKILS